VRRWNTDIIKHLFTFREYSGSRNPIPIERNIEYDLVSVLRVFDVCLTETLSIVQNDKSKSKNENVTCWVEIDKKEHSIKLLPLLSLSRRCGYEISNLLFSWVAINLKSYDDAWQESKKKLRSIIAERCDLRLLVSEPNAKRPSSRTAVLLRKKSDDE